MQLIRDIFRRRLRSLLTVTGIAIGVFAIVVLGAMAEKASVTLESNGEYYADKVTIVEERGASALGFGNANRPLTVDKLDELRDFEGVRAVVPQVLLQLDDEAMPIGVPPLVVGGFLGSERGEEEWEVTRGRMITESDAREAVVGADLVEQLDAKVGETVELRGERFEVAGLLEKSYTMMDQAVMVPLADARALLLDTLPAAFAEGTDPDGLALQATVYVAPGADADEMAARIGREVDGVKATGPTELKRQLGQTSIIFSVILAMASALALVVGGLSIVNTMTVSVAERTREMGVKRALGASTWRVARDVFAEAAVAGGLGGVLGLAFGALVSVLANLATAESTGIALFTVTGRLAVGSVLFSIVLGTVAGAYPAWYAARMDPVDALAYE